MSSSVPSNFPVTIPGSPLDVTHLSSINAALDAAKKGQVQIDLAKRAGIDVSASEQSLRDNVARLLQIKQVYFPGQ